MTTLTCPKCRQGMTDAALDLGQCPACGFPIDGPLVFAGGAKRRSPVLLFTLAGVIVAGAGVAGYALFGQTELPPLGRAPEVADATNTGTPPAPVKHIAPFPHAPKPRDPNGTEPPVTPKPPTPPGTGDNVPPVVEPKKDGPRPVGVVMKVDPRIAPKRHFDHPDDTAALPDLNSGDHVVLTGKVRTLRIGSVNGNGSVDASGLVAEEIVITGDLNGESVVTLNAPNAKVTVGGYVVGKATLKIIAPGGEVVVLAKSGQFAGGSTTTLVAKRLDVAGKLGGGAKLHATLTAGGSLKLTTVDEGAVVTYKKAAASDPALVVERGVITGGGKVLGE